MTSRNLTIKIWLFLTYIFYQEYFYSNSFSFLDIAYSIIIDWVCKFLISLARELLDVLGVLSMTFCSWFVMCKLLNALPISFFLAILSTTSLHSRHMLIWLAALPAEFEFAVFIVELELLPMELNFDVHPTFWPFSKSFCIKVASRGVPSLRFSDDCIS